MCGIFGIVRGAEARFPDRLLDRTVERLFKLSESRGKESAGLAASRGDGIYVYKRAVPASELIRSETYRELMSSVTAGGRSALIGHSRLVTNGTQENNINNQPVVAGGLVGIHNGIIVNDDRLWAEHPELERAYEVDTEVVLSLMRHNLDGLGSEEAAARATFQSLEGCASVALFFEDRDALLIGTNNASLYMCESPEANVSFFVSEQYILDSLLKDRELRDALGPYTTHRFLPGEGCMIGLADAAATRFDLADAGNGTAAARANGTVPAQPVIDRSPLDPPAAVPAIDVAAHAAEARLLEQDLSVIDAIPRCKRCILPATFPFIEFDDDGVCSLCNAWKAPELLGHEALERMAAPFRRSGGKPDCLVGVSGGRDSCYGLDYIKKQLDMNPIAYTYDWGMVTDLARRNTSRVCAKLGIEHIIVSADLAKKRRYIRKNVTAWLRRPALGMIPLFMAGDKQFYYHANRLSRDNSIDFFVFCAGNIFEKTDFKTGFCGLRGGAPGGILTSLPLRNKLGLIGYYAKQFLTNPGYINSSLTDTASAFFASYFMPHDYLYLFHGIPWDEGEVMRVLRDEYDWECAPDTVATWRIGDGTAAFYNYIYHTVAGFTENDTFRSNQVRAGRCAREKALEIARAENRPRPDAIRWYLDVIGMGTQFSDVIKRINAIPKLYPVG